MSIVRRNLMTVKGYTPYCGSTECSTMPRTVWTGKQFKCTNCSWESSFDAEFIERYKRMWNI